MTLSTLHTALIREQTDPIAQRLDALLIVQHVEAPKDEVVVGS